MKRAALGLIVVLALSLTGQVLKRVCDLTGVPFLTITLLRDFLLLGLFVWALGRVSRVDARAMSKGLFLFILWISFYLFVSAFEDRHVIGLYYVRLYILPVLFFVVARTALSSLDRAGIDSVVRSLMWLNALVLLVAFMLYGVVQGMPAQRRLIFGTEFLPYAWYISGTGGTFMRMGLPFSGPNSLGVYFSAMELLFLYLMFWRKEGERISVVQAALALCNLIGLVATLSRSSMLMLMAALAFMCFIPRFRRSKILVRAMLFSVVVVVLFLGSLLVLELLSNGFVSRWLDLNFRMQDPSIRGHLQSLIDAYSNFEQYYLYGYPRGSVGPKAFMFNLGDRYNVENSVLSVIFDVGLFGTAAYFAAYGFLLAGAFKSRLQLPFIGGFVVSCQFLPYVFEPDVISLMLFIYVLIGRLAMLGYLDESVKVDVFVGTNTLSARHPDAHRTGRFARTSA